MTEIEKKQITDKLLSLPVNQLIEMLINAEEELEAAKKLRRRFLQIRNLVLEPEERRPQGRPKKQP